MKLRYLIVPEVFHENFMCSNHSHVYLYVKMQLLVPTLVKSCQLRSVFVIQNVLSSDSCRILVINTLRYVIKKLHE